MATIFWKTRMGRTRATPSGQARPRRTPQRTCVACRRTGDQRTFVRLVRAAGGGAEVDERGRAPGRGAYLCHEAACWERGAKGALNAALRTNIDATNRAALIAYGARFTTPPAAASAGETEPAPTGPHSAERRAEKAGTHDQ